MVRIRLMRMGARNRPFFRIVVADARFPRDGRFIEKIGWYNPLDGKFQVNVDKAVDWLLKGAQPTETVRSILKKSGVFQKLREAKEAKKEQATEQKEAAAGV